ncbi:MAG: glycosyltransferase family 2 protein [bacterium]|nr:glycosyltransferase family 2 protein [bacterium]
MRERILLFTILLCLGVFLFIFQNYVDTGLGLLILCGLVVVYALYSIVATKYQARKLRKKPPVINEDYKPLVTIMIPAHNEEHVITHTIENIMQIDYPKFEIIVIDDRSTDNTASVINDIANKYQNVTAFIRDKEAFPGKSAVLNDALKLAKGEAILVFDADATVEPDFLNRLVPKLEPADVGAVQARKIIRNKDFNLLAKCQNNEYTMDTHLQVGRDAVKGAVELRGNGELIKRKALEDIGGWNNYTITDDLDMSTRLHIKGWDIRFCADACVYEEGIIYLYPLYRQRRRWLEGTIRRYLEYFGEAMISPKMSIRARFDMLVYITQFIMPIWFVMEVTIRTIKFFTDKINPTSLHNELVSSIFVSIAIGFGFFSMIRYSLRKYDSVPRLQALKQAFETTIYFFMIWFPMVIFICGKILFRKKNMKWGKTAHGLVLEEEKRTVTTENELQSAATVK